MKDNGKIIKISGPLVVAKDLANPRLYDTVLVGHQELLGEIIEIENNQAAIQVYEETSGIRLHEPVKSLEQPLSIQLGPGLLTQILDGIGRDLKASAAESGHFIRRGTKTSSISQTKKWEFHPTVEVGEEVIGGMVLGYVYEAHLKHFILVPPTIQGTLTSIQRGSYTIKDNIGYVETKNGQEALQLAAYWPIRKGRPYLRKQLPQAPLVTGQRIIDTFFPIAKGGTACIPGPFGSGKTVVQHQLAKWSDSDIVIYIGCGERGNEITDVLQEFPQLEDPRTKQPLMNKMVLIANTSNMPVAAREASIYTGMTIAEYFRDMGYNVSLMADSTSRWAEALREMSGRLEEMPGDEGYPAYLTSRLAEVYERAGVVSCLGQENTQGSVTMIGAVSPAGGDLSEPVTQGTLKIVKVFWGLDANLAFARHFPAIHWLTSYSLYEEEMDRYMRRHNHRNFSRYRQKAMALLKEEEKLQEIVQLIGKDGLSDNELLKLEVASMLREDFLQQNAFMEEDTYTSLDKQVFMLRNIMEFYGEARDALIHDHLFIADILNTQAVIDIQGMRFVPENELTLFEEQLTHMRNEFQRLADNQKGGA